jgi:BRCA1-associated protein
MELPTCPLCLEKLDSSATGLSSAATVLHEAFITEPRHQNLKWAYLVDECKVCKIQSILAKNEPKIKDFKMEGEERKERNLIDLVCDQCDNRENLWVCLVCSALGCGRYCIGRHAVKHFQATNHSFSLELASQRIWHYRGDNYVHRIMKTQLNVGSLKFMIFKIDEAITSS